MSVLFSNTSVTHTYGNVACVALNYIRSYFSEDFFKTIHISTRMAYRQLDIFRSKKEFWKREKPMLIIRPRIDIDDSSRYYYGSAMMNRMHNVANRMEFGHTVELLKDRNRRAEIRFSWNRAKILFDVVIIVDTLNKQINIAHSLLNLLVPNTPFMIATPLEGYLPRTVIDPLMEHIKIDKKDTAEVLKYLNTESNLPITYKFKPGSGNNEFFCLYPTNVEAITTELNLDDGSDKGFLQDTFTISFSLGCEFNMMANYFLALNDNHDVYNICPVDASDGQQDRIQPLFSIPLLLDIKLDDGWKIYSSPSYMIPHGVHVDETDLSSIIDNDLRKVILHHLKMNIPIRTVLQVRVFKGVIELPEGKNGYEFNYNTMVLTTYDCNERETYRVFLIVNNYLIHSISAEISENTKK